MPVLAADLAIILDEEHRPKAVGLVTIDWTSFLPNIGIVVGIAAVIGFLWTAWRSFRLLRLYHVGEKRGGVLCVTGQVLAILLGNLPSIFRRKSLFTRTRMRLEFEVLVERPKYTGDDPEAKKAMVYFNEQMKNLFTGDSRETIALSNAYALHRRFEQIQRYFRCLEELKCTDSARRFVTKVSIENGFVAPLHLVAGILRKYEDEWELILKNYDRDRVLYDTRGANGPETKAALKDLREIQQFIFHCWLQWGPSIPICDCDQYLGTWASLQYGFCDENNSVELVGTYDKLNELWDKVDFPKSKPGNPKRFGRAKNVRVSGHIANSKYLPINTSGQQLVGRSLSSSWESDKDGRLVLLLQTIEPSCNRDEQKPKGLASEVKTTLIGSIEPRSSQAYYYSAYLWSNFVILCRAAGANETSEWIPARQDPKMHRRSEEPWLDFVPFFEHGNIADPETYDFLKRQLADKVAAGFAKIVYGDLSGAEALEKAKAYPLKFAFAASVDYPGCGGALRFESVSDQLPGRSFPENSLPDLIQRRIEEEYRGLHDIVLFDYYDQQECPHSSCRIPHDIAKYFMTFQ